MDLFRPSSAHADESLGSVADFPATLLHVADLNVSITAGRARQRRMRQTRLVSIAPSSSLAVSSRMARQARSGTAPEMALRRELHHRGLRFRVDHRLDTVGLGRRRADLVFPRRRVAVFVDGCFWHACPEHATSPRANAEWWEAKLAGNAARDRDTDARLSEAGWAVVRVWEHEPAGSAADRVETVVRQRT